MVMAREDSQLSRALPGEPRSLPETDGTPHPLFKIVVHPHVAPAPSQPALPAHPPIAIRVWPRPPVAPIVPAVKIVPRPRKPADQSGDVA